MDDPALDPTSLRALALSTLKAKRKKVAQQQQPALPSRPPPPTESFQLDYGQEDSTQTREEGEISDEEQDATPAKPDLPPIRTTSLLDSKPSLLDRLSDPRVPIPLPPKPPTSTISPRPSPTQQKIDSEQVRPNIHLNQEQYDRAKIHVLDLLGWGVPSEAFVEYGLTREAVFYIFQELNLRLPPNLDTTGLVSYTPDTLHNFTITPQQNNQPSPTASTPPVNRPTPESSEPKLHDLEQQKRSELLARKIAQASRRGRHIPRDTRISTPVTPLVSTPSDAAVDDFLKSITPSAVENMLKSVLPPVPMEVDPPPLPASSTSHPRDPTPPPSNLVTAPALVSTTLTADFTKTMTMSPPSSSTPATTPFEDSMPIDSPAPTPLPTPTPSFAPTPSFTPAITPPPSAPTSYPPSRRAPKRPVAADFVDYDSRGFSSSISRGDSFDAPHQQQIPGGAPVRRRKGYSSFVSVPTTKFVIDLSDSSDSEGDDEEDASAPTPATATSSADKPAVNGLANVVNGNGDTNTAGAKPSPTPIIPSASAATLQETEREILRMKEWIAKREEQARLKAQLQQQKPFGNSKLNHIDEGQNRCSGFGGGILVDSGSGPQEQEQKPVDDVKSSPAQSPIKQTRTAATAISIQPNDSLSPISEPDARTAVTGFAEYHSLFTSYPALRLRLPYPGGDMSWLDTLSMSDSQSSGFFKSSLFYSPSSKTACSSDLATNIRAIALTRALDPHKFICQYEVPGGGMCRDAGCEDFHFGRRVNGRRGGFSVGVDDEREPNDESVAKYLSSVTGLAPYSKVLAVLQEVRIQSRQPGDDEDKMHADDDDHSNTISAAAGSTAALETRIAQVLTRLQAERTTSAGQTSST